MSNMNIPIMKSNKGIHHSVEGCAKNSFIRASGFFSLIMPGPKMWFGFLILPTMKTSSRSYSGSFAAKLVTNENKAEQTWTHMKHLLCIHTCLQQEHLQLCFANNKSPSSRFSASLSIRTVHCCLWLYNTPLRFLTGGTVPLTSFPCMAIFWQQSITNINCRTTVPQITSPTSVAFIPRPNQRWPHWTSLIFSGSQWNYPCSSPQ